MQKFLPKKFKTFFWDFDTKNLDIIKHKSFIIERILEKGRMEHIKWVFKIYRKKDIKKVTQTSNNICNETKNFWNKFFQKTNYPS